MVSSTVRVDNMDDKCQTILEALEEHEKITAAKASYQFLESSILDQTHSQEERDRYALAMVRRHLIAEDGNVNIAIKKVKSTIKYREKMMIDIVRLCFNKGIQNIDDEEFKSNCDYHRKGIEKELKCGKLYVRGKCMEGRPLYINHAHLFVSGFDKEWYMKYCIFTLEKAIACAEKDSNGQKGKVICVFDMGQFSYSVRPPIGLVKDIVYCLQDHYPERVDKILILDAPSIFRAFYSIIKHFLDDFTRKKVMFVTGHDEKMEKVSNIISDDQALPVMLSHGKVTSDIDMNRYLYEVPFDRHYTDS